MRELTTMDFKDACECMKDILDVARRDGGDPVAACIVDVTGRQLLAAAMDGVKEPSIAMAHAKAVTAVRFRLNTVEFHHVKEGEDADAWVRSDWPDDVEPVTWSPIDVLNVGKVNRVFVTLAGGMLLRAADNAIVGAVGISGRDELEDHKLALTVGLKMAI